MADAVKVIDLEQQYGEQLYNYIKTKMFDPSTVTEKQMEDAYANVRLWLDSKNVSDGIAYIESNLDKAKEVATGAPYEEVLAKMASKIPSQEEIRASRMKLAALAALFVLGFWYLFKDSGSESAPMGPLEA